MNYHVAVIGSAFESHHIDKLNETAQKVDSGTSLVVQWLRCHTPNAGCVGFIPGWGTKILYVTWPKKKKKKISFSQTKMYLF